MSRLALVTELFWLEELPMDRLLVRDEREVSVDRAGDRLAYVVLSFGLLMVIAYRSFVEGVGSWELLGLVVLGGGVSHRVSALAGCPDASGGAHPGIHGAHRPRRWRARGPRPPPVSLGHDQVGGTQRFGPRPVGTVVLSWLAMIGVDFFLHAGLLAPL